MHSGAWILMLDVLQEQGEAYQSAGEQRTGQIQPAIGNAAPKFTHTHAFLYDDLS